AELLLELQVVEDLGALAASLAAASGLARIEVEHDRQIGAPRVPVDLPDPAHRLRVVAAGDRLVSDRGVVVTVADDRHPIHQVGTDGGLEVIETIRAE